MKNPLPVIVVLLVVAALVAAPFILRRGPASASGAELPRNGKPTFVEFKSKTCEICRMMRPGIRKLESEMGGVVNFVILDVDDQRNYKLSEQYDVYSLPTILIMTPDGRLLERFEGQTALPDLRKAVVGALTGAGKDKKVNALNALTVAVAEAQEEKSALRARADMISALLDEYEASGKTESLNMAREASDAVIKEFGNDAGGFSEAANGGDKPVHENVTMADNLIRIHYCAGGEKYKLLAEKTLKILPSRKSLGEDGDRLAVAEWLIRRFPLEIAIVGYKKNDATKALRREAMKFPESRKVILTLDPKEDAKRLAELPYAAREVPVLYACVENACSMPVTDPAGVAPQLKRFTDKFLKRER